MWESFAHGIKFGLPKICEQASLPTQPFLWFIVLSVGMQYWFTGILLRHKLSCLETFYLPIYLSTTTKAEMSGLPSAALVSIPVLWLFPLREDVGLLRDGANQENLKILKSCS